MDDAKPSLQDLYDELERRVADTQRVAEAERVLKLPKDDRVNHLVAQVADQLEVPWCAATIVVPEAQHFIASSREYIESCERDGTKCQFVVTARGTIAINNVDGDSFWSRLKRSMTPMGQPLQAYLGVPLRVRGEVVGSVCIVDVKPREWTAQEHFVLTQTSIEIGKVLDTTRA